MTGDLAVWLRAQLDADEQTARDAGGGGWETDTERCCVYPTDDDTLVAWDGPIETHSDELAPHIARHDPAFTLADITAKKEIVAEHWTTMQPWGQEGLTAVCGRCRYGDGVSYRAPCTTLRLLAQPYAGRPGWHNEWNIT